MLPRFHLQLSNSGLRLVCLGQMGLIALVVFGLFGMSWFCWQMWLIHHDVARYERATERLQEASRQFVRQAAQDGFDLSEPRIAVLGREVRFMNQVMEKQSFSWTQFLSDLESTVPPSVSLNTVAVGFKDATITLTGQAGLLEDLTAFLNALEAHPAFNNAALAEHGARKGRADTIRQTPESTRSDVHVEFKVSVSYQPSSGDER